MPATQTPTRVVPYPDLLSLAVDAAAAGRFAPGGPFHQLASEDSFEVVWAVVPGFGWAAGVTWERIAPIPVGGPVMHCEMCDVVLEPGRRFLCGHCIAAESGEPF